MNQSRARYIYNSVMLWRVLGALLAGLALAFSFPLSLPGVDAFPELGVWHFFIGNKDISDGFIQLQGLGCVALLPLLAALRGARRPAHGFWLGYLCGVGWLMPGLIWLGSFGIVPVLLLPLYFALPLGLFGYLCWWLLNTPWAAASPARLVWGVPMAWTAIEYLRSFGFWAFPWNLLGYGLAREPLLIQGADLGGVYVVSFAIVLCNSILAVLLMRPAPELLELLRPAKPWRWKARIAQAAGGTALLCLLLGYGLWRLDLLKVPQLWPLALAQPARAQESGAGKAPSRPAGQDDEKSEVVSGPGARSVVTPPGETKPNANGKTDGKADGKADGASKSKAGATAGGKRKDQNKNGKAKSTRPVQKVERELPLDVILVQGGLNTRESWRTEGLLEKSIAAYAGPADKALQQWMQGSLLESGSTVVTPAAEQTDASKDARLSGRGADEDESCSALAFSTGTESGGAANGAGTREFVPPPGNLGQPAGTVARDDRPAIEQPGGLASILSQDPVPADRPQVSYAPAGAAAKGGQPQADVLVVWPESVFPMYLDPSKAQGLPREARRLLRKTTNTALLMGAIGMPHDPEQYENGAMFFSREGAAIWPHSKVRVVPFGEVVPFRRAISFLDYPWGNADVTEGRSIEPLLWKGHSLGLLICFDNVFGFLTRTEALKGADSFILMTNNSWYKLPSGVRQHTDIDILRAVENRRWLARVSTTGESHLIDAAGRVRLQSSQRSAAVISGRLEASHERTVYHRVGDLFAQLCLLGAVLLCLPPIVLRRGEGLL